RNDPELFQDIHIEGGTITWANGADIDPDVLYYELTPAWMEEIEKFHRLNPENLRPSAESADKTWR
ncbi:MAG TPA: DUF2442 domain-containing protein, partial [Anaerolineae bacterium]|nr:DUF2442 domain-containing protein [Anaerolineae bacterium]